MWVEFNVQGLKFTSRVTKIEFLFTISIHVNVKAIFAAMNTTCAVVKITPEKVST